MNLEERVLAAQKDKQLRNEIILEYQNFISSCAAKSVGRYITDQDDEWSVALIAFDEAITKYDRLKGTFIHFASINIKSRLIDHLRKENKKDKPLLFSSLTERDKEGNESDFDAEDLKSKPNDAKYEIEALTEELKAYQISFFDLPLVTPKSQKTKSACIDAIRYILRNTLLTDNIKTKGTLPIKELTEDLNIHRKVIERHRKYIIAVIVILTGDYGMIAEYFQFVKEV